MNKVYCWVVVAQMQVLDLGASPAVLSPQPSQVGPSCGFPIYPVRTHVQPITPAPGLNVSCQPWYVIPTYKVSSGTWYEHQFVVTGLIHSWLGALPDIAPEPAVLVWTACVLDSTLYPSI